MGRLAGKVAIVTGAGQGLGLSFAKALAKEGAKITIAEFNTETGAKAVEELKAMGVEALFVQCDVSNEEQVKDVVTKTVETLGTVNILVNNAQASKPTASILLYWKLHMNQWNWLGKLGQSLHFSLCSNVSRI